MQERYGLLGENIFNTDFSFDLEIRLSAGAFVCGEETALIHSVEGKRRTYKKTSPFPSVKGTGKTLLQLTMLKPTPILHRLYAGIDWYAAMAAEGLEGTKVLLSGKK